jgi:hypothetical protein
MPGKPACPAVHEAAPAIAIAQAAAARRRIPMAGGLPDQCGSEGTHAFGPVNRRCKA